LQKATVLSPHQRYRMKNPAIPMSRAIHPVILT
jgi:hypothetical protein